MPILSVPTTSTPSLLFIMVMFVIYITYMYASCSEIFPSIPHVYMYVHSILFDAGIVTNYKEVKTLLQQRGYVFESDTDTEVIAKLIHHLWVQHPAYSFRELVEQVVQQLVRITLNILRNNETNAPFPSPR